MDEMAETEGGEETEMPMGDAEIDPGPPMPVSEADPTYTFDTPGTYDVTLTVTDGGGLTDTATITITVDEINDDDATQISEPQLSGYGLRRFQIGLERRLLDVPFAGRLAGVDVDRHQGLGLVQNDRATGR